MLIGSLDSRHSPLGCSRFLSPPESADFADSRGFDTRLLAIGQFRVLTSDVRHLAEDTFVHAVILRNHTDATSV
jgi:hypothetical protein